MCGHICGGVVWASAAGMMNVMCHGDHHVVTMIPDLGLVVAAVALANLTGMKSSDLPTADRDAMMAKSHAVGRVPHVTM